eukprot:358674-Chlamydomonas_euryale.AAC.3
MHVVTRRVRVTGSGRTKGMPVLSVARQRDQAAGRALSQKPHHCARSRATQYQPRPRQPGCENGAQSC